MTRALLNLANRPFVNRRPVVRLSLLLWVAGLLLLAGNLWLYWDFLAGRGDLDAHRRQVGDQITLEDRRIEALSTELASFNLGDQNDQVRYLNERIQQRRFSWSRLFDELSDVLPQDVRLLSLNPSAGKDRERSGRRRSTAGPGDSALADGKVLLDIEADARNDKAIFELVDALFADPSFDRPNLIQQQQDAGGLIRFHLETYYQSREIEEPKVTPMEPATSGPETSDDSAPAPEATEAGEGETPPVTPADAGQVASTPGEPS